MKVLCVFVIGCIISPALSAEWGYKNGGADDWDGTCKTGLHQSPIDIEKKDAEYDSNLKEKWTLTGWNNTDTELTIGNNGHSVTVGIQDDVFISGGGLPKGWDFKVAQFHFHWADVDDEGSEHTVDGKHYPLEVHFVTYRTLYNLNDAVETLEGLAVLGFFFEIQDEDNAALKPVIDALPQVEHKDGSGTVESVSLETFIAGADTLKFWRYLGSLTTPGCFESVTWTVFQKPLGVSAAQLDAFRGLKMVTNGTTLDNDSDDDYIGLNYRPTQPLNNRVVKTTEKPAEKECPKDTSGAPRAMSFLALALLPVFVLGLLKL